MNEPHSYAGEKWLLFAREDEGFVFTAVVIAEKNVVAECEVDESALKEQSEELGLEVDVDAFKTLLRNALEERQCVDLEVTTGNETVDDVILSLTYKFSPTISRKGVFHLPIVATSVEQSIVTLLASIHAMPPHPTLSEQQQREKRTKESLSVATKSNEGSDDTNTVNIQETNGAATSLQHSRNADATTAAMHPKLFKRRHGPMRRKGPRGAKLVKK